MTRKTLAEKMIVLGVDGLDPRLSKKFVAEGKSILTCDKKYSPKICRWPSS